MFSLTPNSFSDKHPWKSLWLFFRIRPWRMFSDVCNEIWALVRRKRQLKSAKLKLQINSRLKLVQVLSAVRVSWHETLEYLRYGEWWMAATLQVPRKKSAQESALRKCRRRKNTILWCWMDDTIMRYQWHLLLGKKKCIFTLKCFIPRA